MRGRPRDTASGSSAARGAAADGPEAMLLNAAVIGPGVGAIVLCGILARRGGGNPGVSAKRRGRNSCSLRRLTVVLVTQWLCLKFTLA